jgi:hypothetical protein
MTAAASADRAGASRLVAALEHAWAAIRSRHPDVPQVVIVVASGSDPREPAAESRSLRRAVGSANPR